METLPLCHDWLRTQYDIDTPQSHKQSQITKYYNVSQPLDFVRYYLGELEQETVSGSGISWAIRKSEPHPRQITIPPLSLFTGQMPFLLPNQQRQSTEGTDYNVHCKSNL